MNHSGKDLIIMKFIFKDRNKEDKNEEINKKNELLKELKQAREAIDAVYTNLSYVVEPDMIDCCIYELNALQIRYKIILNEVKAQEARACMSVKESPESADI